MPTRCIVLRLKNVCAYEVYSELELEVSKFMNIYEVNVSHAIQICTKNVFKRI